LGTTIRNQILIQKENKSVFQGMFAVYHSVQNLSFSSLLFKNIKIKTHVTNFVSFLYGCKTWSGILSEEYRLRVFENMVLRRYVGLRGRGNRGLEEAANEELNYLYSSPNIVWVIKWQDMGEARGTKTRCIQDFGEEPRWKETTWKT
jgi:hypothetical protein